MKQGHIAGFAMAAGGKRRARKPHGPNALPNGFYYTPETTVITWQDANGSHSGNLDYVAANINPATTLAFIAKNSGLTTFTLGTEFVNLRKLELTSNSLTSLDVSGSPLLLALDCGINPITSLNVTMLSHLIHLDCASCELTSLDVSGNPALSSLKAYNMQIPAIDISNNPLIVDIDLGGNAPAATVAGISNILLKLDAFGLLGGPSGATAALSATAVPNTAARVAVANLLAKGWTLQLDPPYLPAPVVGDWGFTIVGPFLHVDINTPPPNGADGYNIAYSSDPPADFGNVNTGSGFSSRDFDLWGAGIVYVAKIYWTMGGTRVSGDSDVKMLTA